MLFIYRVNDINKYLDYNHVFLKKSAKILLKLTKINKYAIKLEISK